MSETPENQDVPALETDENGGGDDAALPPPPGAGDRPSSINIADEMRQSYRDYSMSVIIGRALPDVRDGLKPVHRRILYAMFTEGLLSNRKFSKCAGVVGEVLKKYHPHGDSAVYDALVRLAQPWNMGMPLVHGQGNFGSVDGDSAAAYRYTEARLQKIAEELLRDIEKNTVDFIPNFDGTSAEPAVLPSRVPNLLVNGSEGIAVAMATRCPPHNLGEIVDALIAIVEERYENGPVVDTRRLMELVKGPDFPTGGMICGRGGILSAFETGKGSIKVRGKADIVDNQKTKKTQILITEIPFQVNKAKLVERIAELVREKKIEGISEIRDESDRDGMQIAIDLRRDAVGEIVLNQLYKHTPLQNSFPVHMLAITNGQPKTLPMRDMLETFIDFRREVVTRRSRYELDEAQKRFHIVAGLLCALDDIDRIIAIIRSSQTTEEARTKLVAEKFMGAMKIALFIGSPTEQIEGWHTQGFAQLDEEQASAILEMRLSRLVGLERDKLEGEGNELLATMARLREILGDLAVLMRVIKDEMKDIKLRFAIPRRTRIVDDELDDLSMEDLIAEEEMVVTISHQGYIKRSALSLYRAQRRGGKGRAAAKTKEEDFMADAFVASTHAYLLLFTDQGRVFWVKVHQLPESAAVSRGRPIVNLVQLETGPDGVQEKLCAVLPVRRFPTVEDQEWVITCTKNGTVKKTDLTQYANPRSVGLRAVGLDEGDELIASKIVRAGHHVLITTADGYAIRFDQSDVRPMGRTAVGVKGVTLREGDAVVSMEIVPEDAQILTVSENGFGKRTPVTEYPTQGRGGKGVITMKTTDRNGKVAAAIQVQESDQVMVLTDGGTLIRVKAKDVSEYSRNTQGVRILNVEDDERVISVTRVADDEEIAGDIPGVPGVDDTREGAPVSDSDVQSDVQSDVPSDVQGAVKDETTEGEGEE